MEEYHPNLQGYESMYGVLPDTQEELIDLIKSKYNLDPKLIEEAETKIANIPWEERDCVFYLVPHGSPRPRAGMNHFYVRGASDMKRVFKKYLDSLGLICTRCEYELTVWLPTPITQMTKLEVYLAEKGLIRPLIIPDWDNLAKTYTDPLQSVLLLNDNLINPGRVEKFYSIKPRIKIHLRWMGGFDSKYNETKTLSSVSYRKFMEGTDG